MAGEGRSEWQERGAQDDRGASGKGERTGGSPLPWVPAPVFTGVTFFRGNDGYGSGNDERR